MSDRSVSSDHLDTAALSWAFVEARALVTAAATEKTVSTSRTATRPAVAAWVDSRRGARGRAQIAARRRALDRNGQRLEYIAPRPRRTRSAQATGEAS
ncbi:MAG: hypothetical protein M3Q47_17755 [Actinomycetota bacterium]|nr:hypothetical protein [Actinomycetota bacterium]